MLFKDPFCYGDFGHLWTSIFYTFSSTGPDNAQYYKEAYEQAEKRTKEWFREWEKKCILCKINDNNEYVWKIKKHYKVKVPRDTFNGKAAPPRNED